MQISVTFAVRAFSPSAAGTDGDEFVRRRGGNGNYVWVPKHLISTCGELLLLLHCFRIHEEEGDKGPARALASARDLGSWGLATLGVV